MRAIASWLGRALREMWTGIRSRSAVSDRPRRPEHEGTACKRRAKKHGGKKGKIAARRRTFPAKKKSYRVVAPGTTWLFDGANLIGSAGPKHAEIVLTAIEKTLKERGYKVVLFLERRCLYWALRNQSSPAAQRRLKEYAKSGAIVLVDDESDLSLLQAARVIPGSVIVSHDHFSDYRTTFGDVLNTHRISGFSCVAEDDRLIVSISGLKDAIVVPLAKHDPETTDALDCATPPEMHVAKDVQPPAQVKTGYLAWGEKYARNGDIKKAVFCFGRIVRRKDAEGYWALSGLYEGRDPKMSRKYAELAERLEKQVKEMRRRNMRVDRERHRMMRAA